MRQPVFESTETLSQPEFALFVQERERAGDLHHFELLNGRVVMNPPAGYPHGKVGNKIQLVLGNFVDSHRLGQVFDSSQGFELPSGDTVEPDHSFVSNERWSAAPEAEAGRFLRVVPDLIAEVLSTKTASHDRGEKKAIYERNQVREYWLVDPRAEAVQVFLLQGPRFDAGRVFDADQTFRSSVLSGLEVSVGRLFD